MLTLALGIGANTAIFSVVNTVLLKPAPYPDPGRIVIFGYTFQGRWVPYVSPTKFNVWQKHTASVQDMAAFRLRHVNLTGGADPQQVPAGQVHANFFRLFGAETIQGRTFAADEDRPNGDHVVVLSYGFWQRRFGGDPQIVGRSLSIDETMSIVIGVLERNFDTAIFGTPPDIWLPLQLDPDSTDQSPSLWAAARLRPDATPATASSEAQLAGSEFRRKFPDATGPNDTFSVEPLEEVTVREARPSLLVLLGAVSFVLLIACSNVASLLLVRVSVRQRELAIRTMVGASRSRVLRQLLGENLLLASAGGALGLAVGTIGIRALLVWNPGDIPRVGHDGSGVTLDWRVLTFTLLVTVTTGLVFGVLPALQASRATALTGRSGRTGTSLHHGRLRALLVIAEMALAVVLSVGALLLIRSFVALRTVDRGFDADRVLTMQMSLNNSRFGNTSGVAELVREGIRSIGALPGVEGVGAATSLPLISDWRTSFTIVGRPREAPSRIVVISYRVISSGYFKALKIPVFRGRAFTDHDNEGAPAVAIINQAMALRFWPQGDPLNDRLIAFPGFVPDDEPARQVVGIVSDIRDGLALDPDSHPTIYVPLAQLSDRESASMQVAWIIRTRTEPRTLAAAIEHELEQVSGGIPVADISSIDELAVQSTVRAKFNMVVLTIFGWSALLLAAIGVYGLVAYSVEQRTHEIGIRIALGARRSELMGLVLKNSMAPILVGIVIGLCGAAVTTRYLEGMLFGVSALDRTTFIAVSLMFACVAAVASYLPARRATRIDPLLAVRWE